MHAVQETFHIFDVTLFSGNLAPLDLHYRTVLTAANTIKMRRTRKSSFQRARNFTVKLKNELTLHKSIQIRIGN